MLNKKEVLKKTQNKQGAEHKLNARAGIVHEHAECWHLQGVEQKPKARLKQGNPLFVVHTHFRRITKNTL